MTLARRSEPFAAAARPLREGGDGPGRLLAAAILAPMPLALLGAPLLIGSGVAVLAWDYAVVPAAPLDFAVYWLALGLAFVGVVVLGVAAHASAGRQLAALGLFGAVTWWPYFLRSPARLLFVDERFHLNILTQLAERGHSAGLPVTLFPLPGTYPGLEDATLALMAVTGLGALPAARVMTLVLHAAIPMLAYVAARGVGLPRLGAFLAALVFAANTSFVFFHAAFSYESLGIVLFLATWALVSSWRARSDARPSPASSGRPTPRTPGWSARTLAAVSSLPTRRRAGAGRRADGPRPAGPQVVLEHGTLSLVLVALPLVAGIAVTHHLSSYILAASLVIAWLALRARRAPEAPGVRNVAFLATAFAAAWFVVSAPAVAPYLASSISARVSAIVDALLIAHSAPRPLFANTDLPVAERLVAFAYPPLVLLLSVGGLILAWRRRPRSPLWIALAFTGPIAWVASSPAVVTPAGELAYRLWPFLFVGVAVYAALALLWFVRRLAARAPRSAQPAAFAVVAVLLVGGFSIGDNQAGRFPTAPTTAAGPANATSEVVAAARFLRSAAGPGHLVDTDSGTASVFATEGGQRVVPWASWFPFVSHDPARIMSFLTDGKVDYLVFDRQITRLPPRYGAYFGAPAIPRDIDPGVPFSADVVARLDAIPGLQRIYESDRIVIWARAGAATAVRRGPADPGGASTAAVASMAGRDRGAGV